MCFTGKWMKLFLKIVKTGALVIVGLAAIMFIAAILVQDKVAGIILRSLSNDISTKFEIGSVKLSFIKRFPRATLDLKDVLVHSSPGFDRTCFGENDTDTLLASRSVIMEFRVRDIIKGYYNINRIGVKYGFLKILTDTAGMVNYEIKSENISEQDNQLVINLEGIHISDLEAYYDNRATKLVIAGMMENGRLRSKISGDEIDFTAKGDLRIDLFSLYNFKITKNINAGVDVRLNSSESRIRFDKSFLTFDNNRFGMAGSISSDNILDLLVTGENINISGLKSYLPENFLSKANAYNPGGMLTVEGKIKGAATRTSNPGFDISFLVQDGRVTYKNSSLSIRNVSLNGSFTNGSKMIPQTSSLNISNFKGKLGSSVYTGSLLLSDFSSLHGNLELKGTLIPAELKEFFNLKGISSPKGSVEIDLRTRGMLPAKQKFRPSDLVTLQHDARLNFKSFGINVMNDKIKIDNTTGLINVSDKTTARDLIFTYNGQQIKLNGTFTGLPEWLAGETVTLKASASVIADRIDAGSFIPVKQTENKNPAPELPFSLPGDMILDVDFNIGNFSHKNFSARNVSGILDYKPGNLNFKRLTLNSLDGFISGDGFLVQNSDRTFMLKGTFNLNEINVKKTFSVFNNFGQSFIKDENLEGILSGSLSILIPMDDMLRPSVRSMLAEGKYILKKGALVNFEPMKELSEFIDISELENIRFEELANDFFIRNNSLYMPQMDVRSSAADLSINGRHGFDNDYEYHVRILLSEILSKKIPKPRPNTTQFGAVKDDGLGRTSLFLKIEDRGDEVKVSYDVKAAGTQVRSEMRKEKQSLKNILNEEYGWFRNDSSAVSKPASTGTPRFKVTWEETDSVKVTTEEPPSEKREPIIRNPFRKK